MPKPHVVESRYDFRGGRNTAISPDLLQANELVDVTNARLSATYGGFSKRSGSQRIHQTAFPAAVMGQCQWDGPSGKQIVVISNGFLWFRSGFDYTVGFSRAPEAVTSKTTVSQGATAGWIDPDGVDNGINSVSQTGYGQTQVAAASRLYNKLGDPAINGNIPAVDNIYTLAGIKLTCDATLASNAPSFAIVQFEYSTDGGVTWNNVGTPISVEAGPGQVITQTFSSISFNIGNASTTQVWVRVALTAAVYGAGTATAYAQIFNTVYKTDNYPFTWNVGVAPFSTTQPAFFQPFRASTAGAPLVLYIASGGHYWSWDGTSVLAQLDAPPNAGQVPQATNLIPYHTRMFAMTASSMTPGLFPKTLFWSKIGDATNFVTGDKTQGGSAVTDFLTGQQLTALEVIGSSLLMCTKDSVMRFTGHASDDIVISQDTEGISAEVGAVGLLALKRFENVAAMFSDRGPYVVTELYAQPMGEQLNPDWFGLDTANFANISIEYNRFRKELLFAVPRPGDGGVPKAIFSQAVRLQAWQGPWIYPFQISYLCKYFDANNLPNVLSGSPDGFVRLMDVGNLDDVLFDGTGGSNITMTVEIPVLHFSIPGLKKALKWMLLQGNLPIGSNLQIGVAFDGGSVNYFPVTPNNLGEENYRVDLGGDQSQGFRTRIIFTESSQYNVTINGFTLVAWNMQRTT